MGEHVGIESDEGSAARAAQSPKHSRVVQKDDQGEGERQQASGKTHLKDELIAVAIVAGDPVAAIEVGFRFELDVERLRHPEAAANNGRAASSLTSGGCSG